MSTKENKRIAQALTEALHGGDVAELYELLSPEFVSHFPGIPQPMNREQYIQFNNAVMVAFPDFRQTVEDMIAEGNKVALRMRGRGTHKGVFQGVSPTGKQFEITGMAIRRIVNDKIVEEWANPDQLGLMQQLEIIPRRP